MSRKAVGVWGEAPAPNQIRAKNAPYGTGQAPNIFQERKGAYAGARTTDPRLAKHSLRLAMKT